MKLSKLLRGIVPTLRLADKNIEIKGLSHNSKTVAAGDLYFALRDNTFVAEAISNGAVAVVTNKNCEGIPCVVVQNVRETMALAAKRFYKVADRIKIFGIVGTNGKTTTSYILKHILEVATNKPVGIIGTITNTLTTPDPIDLHKILFEMYKNGIRSVVMEVSAHAIYYHKVAGIKWAGVIFTNITQDHLDFFGSFEKYKNTKISFFNNPTLRLAAVNADDEYGAEILANIPKNVKTVTYSCNADADFTADDIKFGLKPVKHMGGGKDADFTADNIKLGINGSDFTLNIQKNSQTHKVHIPICGKFNVYNALSAIAIATKYGIKWNKINKALSTIPQVMGRFNTYTINGITVIIDYAHTPDGLTKILTAGREMLNGDAKLICVFGCGGDRDRTKRGRMGQISVALADHTIITSDNPRTEDPDEIIAEIERGIITQGISSVVDNILEITPAKYVKITDRKEATQYALTQAKAGDIIVIAGKGHENYMDINGEKLPYSDAETVKNWIATHTMKTGEN
ncbi:MAG: UDP-N-acetylmuramoyl-L-alanyl-D-glutamate--2,6-diaminopimelate ligase [Christensenellaceae bacterium]|nr:UDP-N-acetylmuramoyl-L-alanyl-D-glutamate--2,6-diaminopimelate ligase [Christensenellaceae bacterium]